MITQVAPSHSWVYRAQVSRVVDGDTIDLDIDVGFRHYTAQRIRLAGLDAPEIRGEQRPAGKAVTLVVKQWVRESQEIAGTFDVIVQTGKISGSFDRWSGTIWRPDGECLNAWLINTGLAKPSIGARATWTAEELGQVTQKARALQSK